MKTRKPFHSQFTICVENSEYPASLELHKLYRILPDEDTVLDGDIRVIDESGEDYPPRRNTSSSSKSHVNQPKPLTRVCKE